MINFLQLAEGGVIQMKPEDEAKYAEEMRYAAAAVSLLHKKKTCIGAFICFLLFSADPLCHNMYYDLNIF